MPGAVVLAERARRGVPKRSDCIAIRPFGFCELSAQAEEAQDKEGDDHGPNYVDNLVHLLQFLRLPCLSALSRGPCAHDGYLCTLRLSRNEDGAASRWLRSADRFVNPSWSPKRQHGPNRQGRFLTSGQHRRWRYCVVGCEASASSYANTLAGLARPYANSDQPSFDGSGFFLQDALGRWSGPVAVCWRSFDKVMFSKTDESWAQAGLTNFARMRF